MTLEKFPAHVRDKMKAVKPEPQFKSQKEKLREAEAQSILDHPENHLLKKNSDLREGKIKQIAGGLEDRFGDHYPLDRYGINRKYITDEEFSRLNPADMRELIAIREYIENVESGNFKGEIVENEVYINQQLERYYSGAKMSGDEQTEVKEYLRNKGVEDPRSRWHLK